DAGDPAHQVRAGDQSQDRSGARTRRAGQTAGDRRRGRGMKRREFIALLGAATLAWPLAARAQQGKVWRIGFLTPRSRPSPTGHDGCSAAFLRGMNDLGYTDGKNLAVEWRYADGDYKRLAGFAAELVEMNLPLIVTYGTAAARVLQGATKTTPIVVAAAVDLVGAGIVASLARPGGNITRLSVIHLDSA